MNFMSLRTMIFFIGLVLGVIIPAASQIGGNQTYNFLNFSNSSRQAALGGNLISVHHADLFIAIYNPSMLSPDFHTSLAANFTDRKSVV